MKLIKSTLIILILFFLFTTTVFAGTYDLVLQWDSNTEPDLATGTNPRYKIYVRIGESLNNNKANATRVFPVLVANDENTTNELVQYTLKNYCDDGFKYYIAVTALDNSGNESELSNEVNTMDVDITPPGKSTNFKMLRWIIRLIGG
jgi:hypothetical protein